MDSMKSAMMKEIGPGGLKCNCCNDALNHPNHPNSRVDKAKARRRARRRLDNETKTIIKDEV